MRMLWPNIRENNQTFSLYFAIVFCCMQVLELSYRLRLAKSGIWLSGGKGVNLIIKQVRHTG